eukprot:TRINITY_DN10709_c0_g1_i1.p1 TRINITY_DN10709_c0_g1~~TRINITY_DN10709_c0_g1_i1.p1  ORF type:complete len:439 (-),score=133.41 TRINITY_DN10709_c0_g1_i1:182-1498(-)
MSDAFDVPRGGDTAWLGTSSMFNFPANSSSTEHWSTGDAPSSDLFGESDRDSIFGTRKDGDFMSSFQPFSDAMTGVDPLPLASEVIAAKPEPPPVADASLPDVATDDSNPGVSSSNEDGGSSTRPSTETPMPPPKKKRRTSELPSAPKGAKTPIFKKPTVPLDNLRQLEFEAYSAVIAAFRAQGELTWQKDCVLSGLRAVLKVSDERHKLEVQRAEEVFGVAHPASESPTVAVATHYPKDRSRLDRRLGSPTRNDAAIVEALAESELDAQIQEEDRLRKLFAKEQKKKKKEREAGVPKEKKPKVKKVAPRNPELSKDLHTMLQSLINKDKMHLFAEPVKIEGYSDVISEPMDFATMKRKLDEDLYLDLESMERDFELICDNAMKFNPLTSEVHNQAQKLQNEGRDIVRFHKTRKDVGLQKEGQVFKLDLGARTVGLST